MPYQSARRNRPASPFPAKYRGRCSVTGKSFPVGTPIVKIEQGVYALADPSFVEGRSSGDGYSDFTGQCMYCEAQCLGSVCDRCAYVCGERD